MVRDLMAPLSEHATVSEDATLYEGIMALEKAQAAFGHTRYRHGALLVFNDDQHDRQNQPTAYTQGHGTEI